MIKNINSIRGDSIPLKFAIKTADGQIVQINDIETLYLTCKKNTDNVAPILFQKTLEDMTLSDDYYHVVIEPEDTEKLNYGEYFFDIEVTLKNGYRKTSFHTLNLTDEVTLHRSEMNGN